MLDSGRTANLPLRVSEAGILEAMQQKSSTLVSFLVLVRSRTGSC